MIKSQQFIKRIQNPAIRLASFEIWIVTAFVAGSFIFARLLPVAVLIAVIFWLIRWVAYGRPSVRTPADWSIGLLVLMIPVTLWATALPEMTVFQVYRMLTGIALFYAIVNWAVTPERIRWIVVGIAFAGIILAFFALISVEWKPGKFPFIPSSLYDRFLLLVSDTSHPNVLAGTIVVLFPVVLAILLFNWRQINWYFRAISSVSVLVIIGVILLTHSRGALMAFGVAIFGLIMLRWRWGWIVVVGAMIFGAVSINYFGFSAVLETITYNDTIPGIDNRVEIWSRAIYMIQDFPFTGVGMGSYGEIAVRLYPFFLAAPKIVPHAHNLFFQLAVDLGIPGLITWLSTLGIVIFSVWQIYSLGRLNVNGSEWYVGLGAGLLCSQMALIVHGLTDAVTWGMVRPAPLVWVLWGMAIATYITIEPGLINSPNEACIHKK